ncbi:MAG: penicillin-binding transpeptidase domain-containing protein [Phycisphaeraceae bacterium]
MFHRRLLLLSVLATVVAAVLGLRTVRLTTGPDHLDRLREAQENLLQTRLIPTIRGRILDRRGRVLAEDRSGYEVAVDYELIRGTWARQRAEVQARRAHRADWSELTAAEREALIAERQEELDALVDEFWHTLAGVTRTDPDEIDEKRNRIVTRVHRLSSYLHVRWQQREAERLGESVPLDAVAQPIAEQQQAHMIVRDVSDRARLTILTFIASSRTDPAMAVWQGVEVRRPRQRVHPLETLTFALDRSHLPKAIAAEEPKEITVQGVGLQVIGMMRDVAKEDVERRPFDADDDLGGYRAGDRAGRSGIEAGWEHLLRGERGREIVHLDTGRTARIDPVPGRDVRLALDIQLQGRIQAIMSPGFGLMEVQPWHGNDETPESTPLNGAAVVLDARTGDVLAMVSTPTYSEKQWQEDRAAIYKDPDGPFLNRVVSAVYAPGSTLKPIIYALAARDGVIAADEQFECRVYLDPDIRDYWRCWIRHYNQSGHGWLSPVKAIATSCNIYFYRCSRALGLNRLLSGLTDWGFGRRTGLLPEESAGLFPDPADYTHAGDALRAVTSMGIGQGPIAVPPIHVATAHMALARGGRWISPTLVLDPAADRDEIDLMIPDTVLQHAREGMHEAANNMDYGTASHIGDEPIINAEGVNVWAKTGTAEAPVQFNDRNENGQLDEGEPIRRKGDYSWYVAHVAEQGETRPRYVVCAMVEYGGSGGRVSGPIVNQIIHALQTEGYL